MIFFDHKPISQAKSKMKPKFAVPVHHDVTRVFMSYNITLVGQAEPVFLVADTRLYTLPCRSVGRQVRRSVTFLNSEQFLQYCYCPPARDFGCRVSGLVYTFGSSKRQLLIATTLFYTILTIFILYLYSMGQRTK